MRLNDEQIQRLREVISGYDFPMVAYDFEKQHERSNFESYLELERYVCDLLRSGRSEAVRNGLSNVLYWGYATSRGRQRDRVGKFRARVTEQQLSAFSKVVRATEFIKPSDICKCGLPQFSKLSFISKVLMFLDPYRYVTLDLQLRKIQNAGISTIFKNLKACPTYLPVNQHNETFYYSWCSTCAEIAREYFDSTGIRAVDVERGIFTLVRNGETDFAARLLNQVEA